MCFLISLNGWKFQGLGGGLLLSTYDQPNHHVCYPLSAYIVHWVFDVVSISWMLLPVVSEKPDLAAASTSASVVCGSPGTWTFLSHGMSSNSLCYAWLMVADVTIFQHDTIISTAALTLKLFQYCSTQCSDSLSLTSPSSSSSLSNSLRRTMQSSGADVIIWKCW